MAERKKIKINIPNTRDVINDIFLPLVKESPETLRPIIIDEGGRGSGKSRGIAEALPLWGLKRKMRIVLVRKVADTIRNSSYAEVKDVVQEWGLQDHFRFYESPLKIKARTGTEFITTGLDKVEKTKSLANVDVVWIEEATELTLDDWVTLSLSVRGETKFGLPKRIILTFNRTSGNWTEEEFFYKNGQFKDNPLVYHIHSTFRDNRFLDANFLARFEQMRIDSPELYRKNAEGLPVALKGLIFANWDVVDEFPDDLTDILYGLDFGFNDPKVLLKLGRRGKEIWVDELFYKSNVIREDFVKELDKFVPYEYKTKEMYADSADPESIEVIYRAGYNIHPADKGKGSVLSGIEEVQSYKIHITRRSTNVRKDFENYKWNEDRNGNPLDEPMDAYSHAPDAVRYPVHTHWGHEYRNWDEDDAESVEIEELESNKIHGY